MQVRILDSGLLIAVSQAPEKIRELKMETDLIRTVSSLAGYRENASVLIRASSDGRLLVATSGTGYDEYTVTNVVTADALSAAVDLGKVYSELDIMVENNDVVLQFAGSNQIFGGDVIIPKGIIYTWNMNTRYFKHRSRNAGFAGNVQVTAKV